MTSQRTADALRALPTGAAILGFLWLGQRPWASYIELGIAGGLALVAAFVLWVGARDASFRRRHPGHAWFMCGGVMFLYALVLLRHNPDEWQIGAMLIGLVALWRGAMLDRRAAGVGEGHGNGLK